MVGSAYRPDCSPCNRLAACHVRTSTMNARRRLIILAATAFMLAGCATQSASDRSLGARTESSAVLAAPTVAPTVLATPTAETTAAATPPSLQPDDVAQVVTTDLVIRSAPGVSAESEIYPELLNEPTLLFVVDGPVAADGYDWYLVEPFSRNVCVNVCPPRLPLGWVAQAGKDGEPWIAPGTLDCPEPDVGDIARLSGTARLACYGNDSLVLEGAIGSCYAAETPIALQQTGCEIRPPHQMERQPNESVLIMRPADGVDMPMDQPEVRITVTGHFDDAAASSCEWSEGFNDAVGNSAVEPPSAHAVILSCRQEFVVTDIAVAGQ